MHAHKRAPAVSVRLSRNLGTVRSPNVSAPGSTCFSGKMLLRNKLIARLEADTSQPASQQPTRHERSRIGFGGKLFLLWGKLPGWPCSAFSLFSARSWAPLRIWLGGLSLNLAALMDRESGLNRARSRFRISRENDDDHHHWTRLEKVYAAARKRKRTARPWKKCLMTVSRVVM